MEEKIKRLKEWSKGNPQPPVGIELAPTLRCNLNCKFCWRREKSFQKTDKELQKEELSTERHSKLLREAKKLDVREIMVIGGGESTFRKDTFQIMDMIKSRGFYGYICTNGTLIGPKKSQKMKDMGWDHVKFSIHGIGETHDQLVGMEGAFERVKKTIEELKDSDVELELGMVVVNKNYDLVDRMVDFVENMGMDSIFLEPITVYSDLGTSLKLTSEQENSLKKSLTQLIPKVRELDIENNFEKFIKYNLVENTNNMKDYILSKVGENNSFADLPCYEPFLRMGIRVDGRVAPCGFFDTGSWANVRKKSLEEIWYGNYFQKRREEQLKNELPDYCSKCCTTLVSNNIRLRNQLKNIL